MRDMMMIDAKACIVMDSLHSDRASFYLLQSLTYCHCGLHSRRKLQKENKPESHSQFDWI